MTWPTLLSIWIIVWWMFVTGESVFVQPRVSWKVHSPESQKASFDTFKKVMQEDSMSMSTFTLFIAAPQYYLRLKGKFPFSLPTYIYWNKDLSRCTSLLIHQSFDKTILITSLLIISKEISWAEEPRANWLALLVVLLSCLSGLAWSDGVWEKWSR